jgi:hypothetical protein
MQFALDFSQKLPAPAQERIADGMQRADDNAESRWKAIFAACILAVARRQPELTSDDVLDEIAKLPNAPSTHALCAVGPAMRRAAQDGMIARTDKIVRSKRPEKRGNFHAVWRSRYHASL